MRFFRDLALILGYAVLAGLAGVGAAYDYFRSTTKRGGEMNRENRGWAA